MTSVGIIEHRRRPIDGNHRRSLGWRPVHPYSVGFGKMTHSVSDLSLWSAHRKFDKYLGRPENAFVCIPWIRQPTMIRIFTVVFVFGARNRSTLTDIHILYAPLKANANNVSGKVHRILFNGELPGITIISGAVDNKMDARLAGVHQLARHR